MKLRGKVVATVIICMVAMTACGQSQRIMEEDFYQSVNGQWLKEHEKESYTYSGTIEQKENVDRILEEYLKGLCEKDSLSELEEKAVLLYEQAEDWEKRNQLGSEPIQDLLAMTESATNLDDLVELYKNKEISYYNNIFTFEVGKDNLDESNQVKVLPTTICGATGSLTETQLQKYKELIKKEAELAGYDNERAEEMYGVR